MVTNQRKVLLLANSFWYLYKFRANLMVKLQAEGFDIVACAPKGDPYQERIQAKTTSFKLDRHSVNPFAELGSILGIFRTFLKERPDVILTFTPKTNLYGGFCARFARIPCIVNISGVGYSFDSTGISKRILMVAYRICLRNVRHVYFQNNQDLRYFDENRIFNGSYSRIYGSGADLQRFTARQSAGQGGRRVFLLAARLTPAKGILDYLVAAKRINAGHPNAQFLCCGPFEDDNVKSAIEKAHADGVIRYLGFLDDMREILEGSDVVVLPTYYNEGVPRILIEAIAMGRAIVTTRQSGCVDVLREGENGFFVPPRDPESLAKTLELFMIMSDAHLATMGAISSQHARERFDENVIIQDYLDTMATIWPD